MELTEREFEILRGLSSGPALGLPHPFADSEWLSLAKAGLIKYTHDAGGHSYEITEAGLAMLRRSEGNPG